MGKFGATHLKFDKDYLNELTTNPNSGVLKRNCKYHIALHPAQFNDFGQSIKDELGRKIGKYDDIFQGIMLGYENVKLQSDLGVIGLENCYVHIDVHADFFVFKPEIDRVLKGIVTRTTKDHVGCLVYSTFNIALPKPEHENNDNWIGNKVTIQSEVEFKIIYVDLNARLPYIRGQLLSVVKLHENEAFLNSKKGKKLNKQIKFDDNFDEIKEEENVSPPKSKKKHKKFDNQDESIDNMDIKEDYNEVGEEFEAVKKSKKHKKKHKQEDDEQNEEVIKKKEKRREKKRQQKEDIDNISLDSLHIKSIFDDSYTETNLSQDMPLDTFETEENYTELNESIHKKKKKKSKSYVKDEIFEDVKEEEHIDQLESSPKKQKKHKSEILENVKTEYDLGTSLSKKKKHSKSFSYDENTLEDTKVETTNELEITTTKNKKKYKKIKKEEDEFNISLESLDIKTLFDDKTMCFDTNSSQSMANNEDKRKRRRSVSVSQDVYLEKVKLEEDSDLEKVLGGKKRKRSKSISH